MQSKTSWGNALQQCNDLIHEGLNSECPLSCLWHALTGLGLLASCFVFGNCGLNLGMLLHVTFWTAVSCFLGEVCPYLLFAWRCSQHRWEDAEYLCEARYWRLYPSRVTVFFFNDFKLWSDFSMPSFARRMSIRPSSYCKKVVSTYLLDTQSIFKIFILVESTLRCEEISFSSSRANATWSESKQPVSVWLRECKIREWQQMNNQKGI